MPKKIAEWVHLERAVERALKKAMTPQAVEEMEEAAALVAKKKRMSPVDKARVESAFKAKRPVADIARDVNMTPGAVYGHLEKVGLWTRKPKAKKADNYFQNMRKRYERHRLVRDKVTGERFKRRIFRRIDKG